IETRFISFSATAVCLIVLYFSVSLDSAFGQMSGCCTYQSIEKALFEYEIKYTYNKTLFMEYNSTRGNWMGFTPLGVFWANIYNRDPWDPEQRKVEQLMLCSETIHVLKDSTSLLAAPSLKLTSVKQPSGTHPALLLCSAYNFYPQDIELTWFQNGQEVTSGVSSTEVLSDGDLYYQIHSYLEYSPKLGEEISCMVEHVSLSEPLVQAWDPPHSLPWSERVKIVLGTLFLVVGLTMLAIGYVKHKKHSAALCTIGQGKLVIMPSQCYKINEHL
uniref:Ig-like domain-containing protein n=1 Tax=Neogobius melanostomus TaxID=47308 RepID=A0A8C6TXS8_9GOBI